MIKIPSINDDDIRAGDPLSPPRSSKSWKKVNMNGFFDLTKAFDWTK